MKQIFLKSFCARCLTLLILALLSTNLAWGETKTEGFETATAGTTYNSSVMISSDKSDCGIGWSIYYGCVSTSNKITGNNSLALRLYTSENYGYAKTTTAIKDLTSVTFQAKAATTKSAKIKVDVQYSTDGNTWNFCKDSNNEDFKEMEFGSNANSYTAKIPSGVTGNIYIRDCRKLSEINLTI